MPLIRYDLGDVGYMRADPCGCGRRTSRLVVLGRVQDTLATRSGQLLTEHHVSDFLYGYPGVDWFQLAQRSDQAFDLQVVSGGPDPLAADALARDLAGLLGEGTRVAVRTVRSIPPENGGKYRVIKSTSGASV